jgi:hypothetical protein
MDDLDYHDLWGRIFSACDDFRLLKTDLIASEAPHRQIRLCGAPITMERPFSRSWRIKAWQRLWASRRLAAAGSISVMSPSVRKRLARTARQGRSHMALRHANDRAGADLAHRTDQNLKLKDGNDNVERPTGNLETAWNRDNPRGVRTKRRDLRSHPSARLFMDLSLIMCFRLQTAGRSGAS